MRNTVKIFCTILVLLSSILAFAQRDVVHGTVKDASGEPIPLAVVLTINPQDSSIVAHTISNSAGVFRLKSVRAGKYWLQAHQMGYITESREVTLPSTTALEFVLRDDPKEIDAVRIGARRGGMSRKGDTVGYNLRAYATGMEKTLGDVLANLPGIKVAQDGAVTAQGKKVDKILFNGQDYFGKNVAMATKNIDANVADTVRVIEGYSEYDIFRGFQNVDKTVIDVGVKKGMMQNVFGKIEAGGGYRNAYMGNLKATYMGRRHMFTALAASNNVAEEVFSIMDYISMQGGLENPEGGYQLRMSLQESIAPIIYPPDNTYTNIAHAAHMLYSYHKEKKLKVNAAALATKAEHDAKSEVLHTFITGREQGKTFTEGNAINDKIQHAVGNFGVTYNPAELLMLQVGASAGIGTLDSKSTINNFYATRLINTLENTHKEPLNWSAKGGIYFRPNSHLYFLSWSMDGEQNKPTYDLNTSELLLPLLLAPDGGRYKLSFVSQKNRQTHSLRLGTRMKLTDYQECKIYLNGTLDNVKKRSYFASATPLTVDPRFDGALNTDLYYRQLSSDLGVRWRYVDEKLNVNVGLEGSYYTQEARQPQRTKKLSDFYFAPALSLSYEIVPGMKIGTDLYNTLNFEGADNLEYGMQVLNYSSLSQNHNYSQIAYNSYNGQLYYHYYPTEASYSIYFNTDYMKDYGSLTHTRQYGLLSVSSPYEISDSDRISSLLQLSNRFGGIWTVSLDGFARFSKDDILVDSAKVDSYNNRQSIGLSARSSYSSFFNVNMRVNAERSANKIQHLRSFIDYTASANIKLLFTYDKFRAEIGGGYSISALDKNSPTLFGLDAELSYEFPYRISAVLSGTNLLNLNMREWKEISYTDLVRSESIYRTIPGYAMFKIRWEFGRQNDESQYMIRVQDE